METHQTPYAFIMHKGTVAPHALKNQVLPQPRRAEEIAGNAFDFSRSATLSRETALRVLVEQIPTLGRVVLATTGFAGRELYAVEDRPNHLYMVGSMGCISSLGLGLAMNRPDLQVYVVDGDGAALMRMGNLATIGTYGGANLHHILLDNGAHDSTGAQSTVSPNVDFATVAKACGYAQVARGEDTQSLTSFLAARSAGPRFLHLRINTGTRDDLPRPRITPPEVLSRLRNHCGSLP
jgi:phosphonopyruvate decarboxylase